MDILSEKEILVAVIGAVAVVFVGVLTVFFQKSPPVVMIDLGEGNKIEFNRKSVLKVLKTLKKRTYSFAGVETSLLQVVQHGLLFVKDSNGVSTRYSSTITYLIPFFEKVHGSASMLPKKNNNDEIQICPEARDFIMTLQTDLIGLNILSEYRADHPMHSKHAVDITDFGKAVIQEAMSKS